MILIDYREESRTQKAKNTDLIDPIRRIGGVTVEQAALDYGDASFIGNGPDGPVIVGIERKKLHDILHCVDDGRLSGHQLVGMRGPVSEGGYDVRVLMVEGHWKPHDNKGVLMESHEGHAFGYCKPGGRAVMYNKLYRYLISVQLSGVIVCYSRDAFNTAFNIVEWHEYFDKPFIEHTSMMEMHKISIPTLNGKPSLLRKWAASLTDVGLKTSELFERKFRKPITLANADEQDFLSVPGVGVKTARQIVKEIWGER